MGEAVQFVPFSSFIEPGFWSELTRLKLHEYHLDDSPKPLHAYFSNSDSPGVPCRLSLGFSAIDPSQNVPTNSVRVPGTLILTNTIEDFKGIDRNHILNREGKKVWESIASGDCFDDPSLLNRCLVTCFADLKKYHYFYWFGYPAVFFPENVSLLAGPWVLSSCQEKIPALLSTLPSKISEAFPHSGSIPSTFLLESSQNGEALVRPFAYLKDAQFSSEGTFLVVCDPSTYDTHPGWPLRNAIAAWAFHRSFRPSDKKVSVICWKQRFSEGSINCGHSLFLEVAYGVPETPQSLPKVVGWEKNEKGKLGPRFVDMSSSMDPVKLAENAVNLNLELMRWRLVPELDLKKMKDLKCLLFGAGTLGCNVARCLLAWGVHHITFVDNAKVSYSNPVRQSLFRFQDSLNGGGGKAETAARSLLEIVPSATVEGHQITVPMPGHIVSEKEEEEVKASVEKICQLVEKHDVVFLLMDTREGRWLPTLLATFHSKLALSVALGFDSYVVIRHGWRTEPLSTPKTHPVSSSVSPLSPVLKGDELGCYFCCDVTAPGNSAKDRSLDQQCTVTRPGVSVMAGALAVETLSSLVQHPDRGLAPASATPPDTNPGLFDEDQEEDGSCLGSVPHQIRGYVSRFRQITPSVHRFSSCVACSERVMKEYKNRGWEFLRDVFNSPKSLERITGLEQLQNVTEGMEVWELSDTESVKSMD